MLTNTLRTLEEDGLIHRKVYTKVPPCMEYTLTERALSFLPYLNALIGWAKENICIQPDQTQKVWTSSGCLSKRNFLFSNQAVRA